MMADESQSTKVSKERLRRHVEMIAIWEAITPDAGELFNASLRMTLKAVKEGRLNNDDDCLSHSAEPPLVEPPKFNHE